MTPTPPAGIRPGEPVTHTHPPLHAVPAPWELTGTALLQVEALECVRRHRILFSDLSFALHAGEWAQVKGANGSGKTSLLRILCGLSKPEQGNVWWVGHRLHEPQSRAQISFLGHAHGVKGDLTPYENLQIARRLALDPALSADSALHEVGLNGLEDVPCRTLSAGQCRRVALARLLVVHTRLWILDEPLTALDAAGITLFQVLLGTHLEQGGLAIVSTHQPLVMVKHLPTEIHLGNV